MKKPFIIGICLTLSLPSFANEEFSGEILSETFYETYKTVSDHPTDYKTKRPDIDKRLFRSEAIEKRIREVKKMLKNPYMAWMFENCFPNTLDTTVYYTAEGNDDDTFVITGDIDAMWLRDSAAQVWPYLPFIKKDEKLRRLIRGVIRRQFKCILMDPYANAFSHVNTESEWKSDYTTMKPGIHERKYELDCLCYPIRLAYAYWKETGDTSIFDEKWKETITSILKTMHEQQRKEGLKTSYKFMRRTHAMHDTVSNWGYGHPCNPIGLIASTFRPSDDSTIFPFLIPSNFFAVTCLRKASEILRAVNKDTKLADLCTSLADEVHAALKKYAIVDHPKYGKIYAFEIDGFGSHLTMDDANVPSLLAMPYLGDININDPIYQNTRRFIWSKDNPYFFKGAAGEGIGGPHEGYDSVWPMSIILKAMTSNDDKEIKECLTQIINTDAGTGFIHEAFNKDDAKNFTRAWFAWANTLFGELILKLIDEGKLDIVNSVEMPKQ